MTFYDDGLDDFFARSAGRARPLVAVPSSGTSSRAPEVQRRTSNRPASARSSTSSRQRRSAAAATTRSSVRASRPAGEARGHVRPVRPASQPRPPRAPRPVPDLVDEDTINRRTQRRLICCVVAVVVLAAGMGLRMGDIQLTQRDRWMAVGADARDGYRVIPAGRGAILDRNGQALAISVVKPNVVADPKYVTDPAGAAAVLAPILLVDEETLPQKVAELTARLSKTDTRYQLLAPTVTDEVKAAVEAALDEHGIEGVSFEDQYVREYPSEHLARGIVGKTFANGTTDDEGRQGNYGIERAFDDQLAGTPGRIYFERDVSGRTIADTPEKLEPSEPGTDVYLTIDQSLQYATEQALMAQVEATGAEEAMAIISEPSTGDILAMASVAYNDKGALVATGDNRAVSTVFEPGSVSKMITVAGAMEEGIVTPNTVLNVPDSLTLYDHTFTDHDPHPDQAWTTTDILVTSSNIGTIKIAQQLGKQKLDQYQRAFGFGRASGSDIPGEVNGLMLDPDDWSGTSIGAIPIGQGISVTALQMLAAYNVISNDGIYVAPRLVGGTDDGSGREPASTGATHRVISADNAQAMRSILAKVVTEGTGASAAVPGYTAFGKTGTARIPQDDPTDPTDAYRTETGGYEYQSSFVGGVDGADLSIIVTVKNAKTSIYGSEVAGPVFAQLASLALRSEQIPPPSLLAAAEVGVPELSTSAKNVDGEDPGLVTSPTQG